MIQEPPSEASILAAGFESILRRPLETVTIPPGSQHFSSMETSSYGNTVAVLLLLLVVEAPAVHAILGAVMDEGVLRGGIRAALLVSSAYLAVWLLGDLRLLRETPGISLDGDVLRVALGARVHGEVRLSHVTSARRLTGHEEAVRAIRITPQPTPNCRIHLSASVTMRGIFGISVAGEALDVYVDDPDGLVSAVAHSSSTVGTNET